NVGLPGVSVPVSVPSKPWEVSYSPLGLNFTLTAPTSPSVRCTAVSNRGDLTVQGKFLPTGETIPLAPRSEAVATIAECAPGAIKAAWLWFFGGLSNDCVFNGAGVATHDYLLWQSDGFTTDILGATPSFLATGPLNYYVDLTNLGLDASPIESVLR